MPVATSPSAMPFTSSGCNLQNSAIWSKVSEVFSTSQTAVALGISGASVISSLLRQSPESGAFSRPAPGRGGASNHHPCGNGQYIGGGKGEGNSSLCSNFAGKVRRRALPIGSVFLPFGRREERN